MPLNWWHQLPVIDSSGTIRILARAEIRYGTQSNQQLLEFGSQLRFVPIKIGMKPFPMMLSSDPNKVLFVILSK